MKINAILTLVAATLVCKATADCFADKYGFPCCSETKDIVAIENNIKWGYENGIKCAIEPIIALKRRSNETCTPVPIGADYMQKLEITNLCPAEALTPQEGIEYPTAQKVTYYSQYAEKEKQMNVILPVGYTEEKKYPVLYLLHGFMGDEDTLLQSNVGVDTIPAYLHSLGKAKEMIVVLPDEYTPPPGKEVEPDLTSKEYTAGYDTFINDLVESIMPYMKEHYSIATGKENTAIAGFSMGGRNSLYIGVKRPDLFGYVGAFAPAPGIVPADDWTGHHDGLMSVEEFGYENKAPFVTLIDVGTADKAVGTFPKEYHELFERNGNNNIYFEVPGADHNDTAVAAGLYNFVQTAFGALNPEPECTSVNEEQEQEQNEVDSNPEVELSEEEEQEQGEEQGNVDPKNPYVVYVTKTKVVTKTAKATKTVKVTKTAKVTLTKTAVKTLKTKKTKKVVKTVSKSFNTEN